MYIQVINKNFGYPSQRYFIFFLNTISLIKFN